jgi:hypothetical protein
MNGKCSVLVTDTKAWQYQGTPSLSLSLWIIKRGIGIRDKVGIRNPECLAVHPNSQQI